MTALKLVRACGRRIPPAGSPRGHHGLSEFALVKKPIYKKPSHSRDKVEPTGRRYEHRRDPTDRQ
jgi:hypothetical protein